MVGLGVALVWFILGVAVAVVIVRWARGLWRRRKELSVATKAVAAVAVTAAMFAVLGTLLGLINVFGAVRGESVEPSQKARILGQGISAAMNCTAFGIVVALPSIIVFRLMTRKRRSQPKG